MAGGGREGLSLAVERDMEDSSLHAYAQRGHRRDAYQQTTVFFQLMDTTSGNVIRDYDTEDDALDELRGVARNYGLDDIRSLALLKFEDGHPTLVAMDD